MNRTTPPARSPLRPGWILAAIAWLAASSAACDSPPIYIVQHQVISPDPFTGACIVRNNVTDAHLSSGVMDLSLANTYVLQALFASYVPTRGPYFVDGADVRIHAGSATGPLLNLRDAAGQVPSSYRVNGSATILPNETGRSLAVGALEIISPRVGSALAGTWCTPDRSSATASCPVPTWPDFSRQYVAVIRAFGHDRDDNPFVSTEFEFPITFCCHCLVRFGADTNFFGDGFPNCDAMERPSGCNPGMDQPVDCSSCARTSPTVCEPRGYSIDPRAMTMCPTSP